MNQPVYAHSLPGQPPDKWQPLDEHLRAAAELAKEFDVLFGKIFGLKTRRGRTMLFSVANVRSFDIRGDRHSP